MFPDSPMFSKILDNLKSDLSKQYSSNSNNNNPNLNTEGPMRAKSSLNRKNILNKKYALNDIKQINTNNNIINHTYNNTYDKYGLNNNTNTNPYQNLFSSHSNFSNPGIQENLFRNSSLNFNKTLKPKENFNINNYRLSYQDFGSISNSNHPNAETHNNKFAKDKDIKNYKSETDAPKEFKSKEKLIEEYRLQLNKELLRKLHEEKEKEKLRENLLNSAKDKAEKKKMEERFIFERAVASNEIILINEYIYILYYFLLLYRDIEKKLNEFKAHLELKVI